MGAEVIALPRRGDLPAETGYSALPPRDVWEHDLDNTRLEMPVDERGLVDTQRLVEAVSSLIDPDYEWPNRLSVHHLYWHKRWYGFPSAGPYAESFRDLSINKILVPRMFENVLHRVMEPPAVPHTDVMEHRLQSWLVARHLFKSVRSVVRWEKSEEQYLKMVNDGTFPKGYETEDEIGREMLRSALQRQFKGVALHMHRLSEIPPEFRLIEPDIGVTDPTGEAVTQRHAFAAKLGGVVMPNAVPVMRQLKVA